MEQLNDKCIFTVITDGYNVLREPKFKLEGWDMICFTDDKDLKSERWQIEVIPEEFTTNLGPKKTSRLFKILSTVFLRDYETTVYIDGNVTILDDPSRLINKDFPIQVMEHPTRNCIYSEGLAVERLHLEPKDIITSQMNDYIKEGMPERFGLGQNCIIIRNNTEETFNVENTWWQEVKKKSYRDQLSLMYALWKNDCKFRLIDKYTIRQVFKKDFGRTDK